MPHAQGRCPPGIKHSKAIKSKLDISPLSSYNCAMRSGLFTTLFTLLMLLFIHMAGGETIAGKCIAVADGDTATVQTADGKKLIIRFNGIDAPEKDQAYVQESKEKLTRLILGKQVRVKVEGTDHYKRTLGQVYQGKKRINKTMVAAGCAWHYDHYAPDDKELAAAQRKARGARIGLWKEHQPTPPWQWRRERRQENKKNKSSSFWPF